MFIRTILMITKHVCELLHLGIFLSFECITFTRDAKTINHFGDAFGNTRNKGSSSIVELLSIECIYHKNCVNGISAWDKKVHLEWRHSWHTLRLVEHRIHLIWNRLVFDFQSFCSLFLLVFWKRIFLLWWSAQAPIDKLEYFNGPHKKMRWKAF